jgi:argininosuccinate lyase
MLALQIGQLLQDLYAPFYLSEPWLSIDPASKLTGISSMMPQKRNPRILEPLREHASVIVGSAQSVSLLAHNIISGMSDIRETVTTVVPLGRAHDLLVLSTRTLQALVIDPQRSLAEVNREYSTMTNLAEDLVLKAGVPFREAHEFASALTDYGRGQSLAPTRISYEHACRVYEQRLGTSLPLSETEFAQALDPVAIIASRAGRGGPQPAEVERMLATRTAPSPRTRIGWTPGARHRKRPRSAWTAPSPGSCERARGGPRAGAAAARRLGVHRGAAAPA